MTKDLTDEEKRVKIAEACGWKEKKYTNECNEPETRWVRPGGDNLGQGYILPDYLNDLNACHETEKALEPFLRDKYTQELRKIIVRECDTPEHYVPGAERAQLIADFWFYGATARQRCDAFLAIIL